MEIKKKTLYQFEIYLYITWNYFKEDFYYDYLTLGKEINKS